MHIIIVKSFKKIFLKIFNSDIDLKKFSNKLKSEKFINLEKPYKKIKFTLSWISIRWIVVFHNNEINIIPLYIVKKSDKKYWYNLILNKETKYFINLRFKKSIIDMEEWNFEIY